MDKNLLTEEIGAVEAQAPGDQGSYNAIKANLLALDKQYVWRVSASGTLQMLDYTGAVASIVGCAFAPTSIGLPVSFVGYLFGVLYQTIALALQARLESGATMSLYRYGVAIVTDRDYAFPSREEPVLHRPTPDCELAREKDLKMTTERLKEENRLKSGDACFGIGKLLFECGHWLMALCCCCCGGLCGQFCNTNNVDTQLKLMALTEQIYMKFTVVFGGIYQLFTYLPTLLIFIDLAKGDLDGALRFLEGVLLTMELVKVIIFIKISVRAKATEKQVVLEEVYTVDSGARTLTKTSEKVHHAFSIYQFVGCSFWSLLLWLYDAPVDAQWQLNPYYTPSILSPFDPTLAAERGVEDGCACGVSVNFLPGIFGSTEPQAEQLHD